MPFATINNLKLGNMRKATDWCFDPRDHGDEVVIQSDNRIARVNLTTGQGVLSSGKGGHPGSWMLAKSMGATDITVPAADLERLREAAKKNPNMKAGQSIVLTGERAGLVS